MAISSNINKNNLSNKTQDINPQCKIVVYSWSNNSITLDRGIDSVLTKAVPLDVSSQILSASFTKPMGSPTGNFTFTLSNSPNFGSGDWKDVIKRGEWCVIYMSQDGDLVSTNQVGQPNPNSKKKEESKKIRCIGFIDRVSVRSQITDKGAFDVVYEVSGRDFGVVYEDTSIWHNVFKFDRIMLDSLADSQLNIVGSVKINKAIKLIHSLFYNPKSIPGAKVNSNESLTSTALQWLMPRQMLKDIGLRVDKTPFWGELEEETTEFLPTEANLAISKPTDYLSGNAWEVLKRMSVPPFHELFTETTEEGIPKLIFRPIPFSIDKSKYRTVGKNITLYKDLPFTEISSLNVIDFNLGEDNHARYNSFLATLSSTLINTEDNVSLLQGSGFPKNIQDSIKRYGFRPMHVTIDSIVKSAERGNGKGNPAILKEYNELLFDYWNNAIFAESGEVSIIGQNSIKLGKCLTFDENTPYVFGKRYYIEGYTDTFTVGERGESVWTQSIMVTRGFEEKDLKSKRGFGTRNNPFNREGEFTSSGSLSNRKNNK